MKVTNREINNIKEGRQVYIITEDDNYNNEDFVLLECELESIEVEITIKYKYNSLDDCFSLIPYNLFGDFKSKEDAKDYYKNIKNIIVYRTKFDNKRLLNSELDSDLLEFIDLTSINKNTIGHSSSEVYELKLKDSTNAILKVQYLSGRNSLKEEYERNKWLEGKLNVPKVYYYKELNGIEYYLMEKKDGVSAHKVESFASLVGENLKQIHSIDITNCPFKNNSTDNLLKIAIDKIDIILPTILEIYPEMNKEIIIDFLKNNKPTDSVLVHGDYSLPNILINDNREVSLIDLGDVSISTKYFDLYYLKKSFARNKKIGCFKEFLESYGLSEIDEKSMKWMDIIDKVLF